MSDLDKGRLVAERLGLHAYKVGDFQPKVEVYPANIVHQALADAVEVFGDPEERGVEWTDTKSEGFDTHSAFLIGITPIAQEDEATRLLRELNDKLDAYWNSQRDDDGRIQAVVRVQQNIKAHLARKGQT